MAFTLQPTSGIVYGTVPSTRLRCSPRNRHRNTLRSPHRNTPPLRRRMAPRLPATAPHTLRLPSTAPSDRRPATGGFMMGPSLGLMFPGGQYAQSTGGEDTSMRALAGTGAGLGVEAGFRFARRLYLGFVYDHAFLSGGNASPSDGLGSLT